jgi:hypothetical protein
VALPEFGKHVPLGVSPVARLNVTFICDSCGRQTDTGISQEVNYRYCTDFTHPTWTVKSQAVKIGHSGTEPASWSQAQPDGVQERGSSTGSTP